jgi:hypothetical protein
MQTAAKSDRCELHAINYILISGEKSFTSEFNEKLSYKHECEAISKFSMCQF